MSRGPSSFLVLAVASIAILEALVACAPTGKPQPQTAINLPAYPGATASTQPTLTPQPGDPNPPRKMLLLETPDSPAQVFAYYKDVLLKDNWKLETTQPTDPTIKKFRWEEGCPLNFITLVMKPRTTGGTLIEVLEVTLGC